jgi:hypothetical protein
MAVLSTVVTHALRFCRLKRSGLVPLIPGLDYSIPENTISQGDGGQESTHALADLFVGPDGQGQVKAMLERCKVSVCDISFCGLDFAGLVLQLGRFARGLKFGKPILNLGQSPIELES